MTTQTQDKTNRMCDAAWDHIKGVHDDLGMDEAMQVYRAQTAAFVMLMKGYCGESKPLAVACTTMLVIELVDGLL